MTSAEIKAQFELEKRVTMDCLSRRFDVGETPFLTRQLLAIKAKLFEIQYPDLIAQKIIPVDRTVDPGATKIAYHEVDMFGKAKIIGPNAKVIPRVDVSLQETQTPVVTLADMYAFEWHELQAASLARRNGGKVNLPEWKAKAARRGIDEAIDEIFWIGNADAGLGGLANNSSVTATASGAAWSTYNAKQIYDVMTTAANLVLTDTKGRYRVTRILLPLSEYARIQVMPWGYTIGADPVYNDLTVLKFIQTNNPGIEIIPSVVLESVSGSKRMVLYVNDSDVLEGQLPLDFEVLPPETEGLETKYICLARCGGVVVRQPKAMRYVTGL